MQSTGLIFVPSLPIGKKLGSNVAFVYSKKLCAKFYTMHRVCFCIKLHFSGQNSEKSAFQTLTNPPDYNILFLRHNII